MDWKAKAKGYLRGRGKYAVSESSKKGRTLAKKTFRTKVAVKKALSKVKKNRPVFYKNRSPRIVEIR